MKIKSEDLFAQVKKKHVANLTAAFKSGNEDEMAAALSAYFEEMSEKAVGLAQDEVAAQNQRATAMAARGANILTPEEKTYYEGIAAAVKSADPKAALANYEVAMPQTVITRVVETIRRTHPLLDRVNFTATGYLTRILANAKPGQLAAWGKITGAVTQEIEGAVQEIQLTINKLSAFMAISMDLVELGPEWIDTYCRETLAEAIACALEVAIVSGDGKDKPIGMIRDLAGAVSEGVYPKQTATKVTTLDVNTCGALVADLARDPNDPTGKKSRAVDPRDIIFVFNPMDYWKKVFGATTVLVNGKYVSDVLPIPAEVFQSEGLDEGEAVIGIAPYYFAGVGQSGKTGTITADDSVKFLEDQRAYKAKLFANGRPMDKYAFKRLDVSEMKDIIATTVKVAGTVETKAKA